MCVRGENVAAGGMGKDMDMMDRQAMRRIW
jgi:hypothetical protein